MALSANTGALPLFVDDTKSCPGLMRGSKMPVGHRKVLRSKKCVRQEAGERSEHRMRLPTPSAKREALLTTDLPRQAPSLPAHSAPAFGTLTSTAIGSSTRRPSRAAGVSLSCGPTSPGRRSKSEASCQTGKPSTRPAVEAKESDELDHVAAANGKTVPHHAAVSISPRNGEPDT